jgi:hypothetical protein
MRKDFKGKRDIIVPDGYNKGDTFQVDIDANKYDVQATGGAGTRMQVQRGDLQLHGASSQDPNDMMENIIVPDGYNQGDTFHVEIDGNTYDVQATGGAGTQMQVRRGDLQLHQAAAPNPPPPPSDDPLYDYVDITVPEGVAQGETFSYEHAGTTFQIPAGGPSGFVMKGVRLPKQPPKQEQMVTLTVPDGCEVGGTFTFEHNGQMYYPVATGTGGSQMQVRLGDLPTTPPPPSNMPDMASLNVSGGSTSYYDMPAHEVQAQAGQHKVIIPEGVGIGESFQVELDGRMFTITAEDPPGHTLFVTVPPPPKEQAPFVLPEGSKPGDLVTIMHEGREVEITVPQPGEAFHIPAQQSQSQQERFFELKIPAGFGPGDIVPCKDPDGNPIEFEIPAGKTTGDLLRHYY